MPSSSSSSIFAVYAFAFAGLLKLLLTPSYRSTDFEVHRHWLSLTYSLPVERWYLDESSIWTLDYPPLFGYLSYLLSLPALLFHPSVLSMGGEMAVNHDERTVLYMRMTVWACDFVLLISCCKLVKINKRNFAIVLLVLFCPGLMIVDHVHFQYNGILLGVLGLSLGFLEQGKDLKAGFLFAILICSKHLFLVAAPVYFVYLLRHYCWNGLGFIRGFKRFLIMGFVVASVFMMSFGPFLYYGQMKQVLSRLFPFGRGLCHAYWAPNIWVFYIISDKILAFSLSKLGFHIEAPKASFTGGLVGNSSPFSVLPQVSPIMTFGLVLFAMSPCLIKAYKNPKPQNIIRWISYAFMCGFMFGWHVHEKASLHFIIPLAFISMNSFHDAKHYFLISIVSCYSMFPLLFEPQEYLIKILLLLTYTTLMWILFSSHFAPTMKNGLIGCKSRIYLVGIVFLELYVQFIHVYLFGNKFEFLPLMLISFYCAIGMVYSWIWQLIYIINNT